MGKFGIKQFEDLFPKNSQLKLFIDLRTEYGFPNTDFKKNLKKPYKFRLLFVH